MSKDRALILRQTLRDRGIFIGKISLLVIAFLP